MRSKTVGVAVAAALSAAFVTWSVSAQAWEPTKTVEFIVPAGQGGGADQMARAAQAIIAKHKLMNESMVVINKRGGSGAEGFLDVKGSQGNPHKIIITLSNLFTTPLATGIPFNWRDITPVKMLALDNFVLWVNAATPYKTPKDYIDAVKKAGPGKMKMGGTGSKQEDQIITVAVQKLTGAKWTYIPFKGGGTVAVQLVGKHIDSSVNNPIEAVAHWRGGKLRPLCVFNTKRMPYKQTLVANQSWSSVPTCKETGLDVSYLMLRGIFMPGGVSADQVKFYVELFRKVQATQEWKDLMEKGAFDTTSLEGKAFEDWVAQAEATHVSLMKGAGFISGQK